MPRRQTRDQEPSSRRGGRLFLLAALLVAGVAIVAVAGAGIARSRPEPLTYDAAAASLVETETARVSVPATPLAGSGTPAAVAKPKKATVRPAKGQKIGTLTIPALKRTLPIIEGTDDAQLEKGVGHFAGSAMPGGDNNCILSGHRDTVFTGLGEVGVGDRLVVRTKAGEFTYKVRRVRIVHKDDKTVIVPADHAVLTVTTCYPFNYVGAAPDRYILIADLLGGTKAAAGSPAAPLSQ